MSASKLPYFFAEFEQVAVGHPYLNLTRGATNDASTKLYGWNAKEDSIVLIWIDYIANTIESKSYKNTSIYCKPSAPYHYGTLIYYKNQIFKFGGIETYVNDQYTNSNEFFSFSLSESSNLMHCTPT